jgi:hypothetical protein
MGQMEMECILYFYMNQGYSGERSGPWASCFSYSASKRSGEYEIAYAHLFSFMTDQRNLKLCTMLHCHLQMCRLFRQKLKDPILSIVDPKVVENVK